MAKGKKKKEPGTSKSLTVGSPRKSVAAVAWSFLDQFQYLNRKSRILAGMPSEYWADQQFEAKELVNAKGERYTRWIMRDKLTVPDGFRVCDAKRSGCGRRMPGIAFRASVRCDECLIEAWELPKAIAAEKAAEMRARAESMRVDGVGNPNLWALLGEVLEQLPQTVAVAVLIKLGEQVVPEGETNAA